MTPTLRHYQEACVTAMHADLQALGSALGVMATGTGKTPTIATLARRVHEAGGVRVLAIAQREELLHQIAGALQRFAPKMTYGLDVADVRCSRVAIPDMVIASVDSLQGARLASFPWDTFGLVICDEAHHAVASKHRKIFDHFHSSWRAGFTATPDRLDKASLGRVFSRASFTYDIKTAIEEGFLSPVRQEVVHVDGLDLSKVRKVSGQLSEKELEELLCADDTLSGMTGPILERSGDRAGLIFAVTIPHAYALARRLNEQKPGCALVVHGELSKTERRAALRAYTEGEVQYLVNVALLTEGVDLPRTEVVAMCRPTLSRSLYTQMIGRGTRLFEGKPNCLVLDFAGNAGKHRLISVVDVLAPDEEERVVELAQRLMVDDPAMTLFEALKRARELIEAEKKARALELAAEREAKEKKIRDAEEASRQLRLQLETTRRRDFAPVAYGVTEVDPFSGLDAILGLVVIRRPDVEEWEAPTDGQIGALMNAGYDPGGLDRKTASQVLDKIFARRDRGLCSLKQARILSRHGLRHDLSFEDARAALDQLASNRWRVPADMNPDFFQPKPSDLRRAS
ncbi:MAG: DEAD/DEAH box helicase family protein [Myxococcales bacterium]|nr:DEAD/DEAH box helicase family protein [Myxococcales bacterium]